MICWGDCVNIDIFGWWNIGWVVKIMVLEQ